MSDDIRVYWDKDEDEYIMIVDGVIYYLENAQHDNDTHWWSDRFSLVPSYFELVYDSSEHEESEDCSALIDENLIIPTISDRGLFNELHLVPTWCIEDFTIFFEGHERLLREQST